MGKRKSSKKPQAKKGMAPLSSAFKCLFCHHDKAVSVKMDKASMFGHLVCKICGQKYSTPINNLSVAVDVYCDWVDACEEVRQSQPKPQRAPRGPEPLSSHGSGGGASLGIRNAAIADADEDAEGEYEEEDPDADLDDVRNGSGGVGRKEIRKRSGYQEIDGDEDEDEEESDRGKRRRVADYDDDDDDDDD